MPIPGWTREEEARFRTEFKEVVRGWLHHMVDHSDNYDEAYDRFYEAFNPEKAAAEISFFLSLTTIKNDTIFMRLLALTAWALGPLPFRLLPGAFLFLVGYSFTKRFTLLSHFILGFTDGLAPIGAWAAIRGSVFTADDLPAWILLAIVTLWIGGFDLIYACQDVAFDRREGLHSIPARFGIPFALRLSIFSHLLTMLLLIWLGVLTGLGWPYWIGLVLVAALLAWEHLLVQPDDLSKINLAFFNINSYISITLFISILVSLYLT